MIELGQTVRDVVTGLEGVAVSRHEYLYGCVRVTIQPAVVNDKGEVPEDQTFDEQQLRVVEGKPNVLSVAPMTNRPGGDRPVPSRPKPPAR